MKPNLVAFHRRIYCNIIARSKKAHHNRRWAASTLTQIVYIKHNHCRKGWPIFPKKAHRIHGGPVNIENIPLNEVEGSNVVLINRITGFINLAEHRTKKAPAKAAGYHFFTQN